MDLVDHVDETAIGDIVFRTHYSRKERPGK